MPTIVFSHGNSFPASTYRVLFRHLEARGFTVHAIEKYGHDPAHPVTNNWPAITDQLINFAKPIADKAGQPIWLVGHSLGGILSIMAAAQCPQLACGVVVLDSPVLGGWRSTALGLMKSTKWVEKYSPSAISRKRRSAWPSVEAALAHFQSKPTFARWHPEVLLDYVTHGTVEQDGQRVLSFDRDVESAIYNTLPNHIETLLAAHPLQCPASFIGGLDSRELKQVGIQTTRKIAQGRVIMLNGTHLFPMEYPETAAAAVEAAILNMKPFVR